MTTTRREFLTIVAISLLSSACGCDLKQRLIGVALGGGGAKGLAHIPMLEGFDELGIRPHRIAGTSIGAVMGCLCASGLSGAEIRQIIDRLPVSKDENWLEMLFSEDILNWFKFLEPSMGKGGLIESEVLVQYLLDLMKVYRFSQLQIPYVKLIGHRP